MKGIILDTCKSALQKEEEKVNQHRARGWVGGNGPVV